MSQAAHASLSPYAANIPRYFFYIAFRGFGFGLMTATWVIYLQQRHGLSLTQVTLVDVAFWLAATLGEVPTGVVADSYGRKTSLAVGTAIMALSMLAWTFAPSVPLIALAYVFLAIGATFLSGAEDALFFESLKITGRVGDYPRLAGRVSATMIGAIVIGNLASGLLASLSRQLPFIISSVSLFVMLGIVLGFKEPKEDEEDEVNRSKSKRSYWGIVKQAFLLMRARPTLRYAILYMTMIPLAAVAMETVFLQPQAIALGVPLAGVGVVVMAAQFANMLGATSSHRIKTALGDARVILAAPYLIAASLILLGLFQQIPALVFAATISFVTASLRPLVMSRIQGEVTDNIRATVLSMQSLMFAFVIAFVEPLLGYLGDLSGLPVSYFALAGGLAIFSSLLFWRSRSRFP